MKVFFYKRVKLIAIFPAAIEANCIRDAACLVFLNCTDASSYHDWTPFRRQERTPRHAGTIILASGGKISRKSPMCLCRRRILRISFMCRRNLGRVIRCFTVIIGQDRTETAGQGRVAAAAAHRHDWAAGSVAIGTAAAFVDLEED